MNLATKVSNVLRRARQSWGSAEMKRSLWNREFAGGRWDFIDETAGDEVYPFVQEYARGGAILDLGCGSGNTGCELPLSAYDTYLGVDISDVALDKARRRSVECSREKKNRYVQADIVSYQPSSRFDVVLFRESIYYVPKGRIVRMLERYAGSLTDRGVFIVRWHDPEGGAAILELLKGGFEVVESYTGPGPGPFIVVFRARRVSS